MQASSMDASSANIDDVCVYVANATITTNATTNTGKATPKNLSPLVTTNTSTTTTNIITNCKRNEISHGHQQLDTIKRSTAQNKRSANNERNLSNTNPCDLNHCIQKESFSCDSISKSYFVPLADPYFETNDYDDDNNDDDDDDEGDNGLKLKTIPIRPPKLFSPLSTPLYKANTNQCLNATNSTAAVATITTTTASGSSIISLSKSETNIAESNVEDNSRNQFSIYNVVSLNDLHDVQFQTLNNLSKNQCFTNSDDGKIETLTGPNVLTTVTVSMRNAADVSDKVF